MTARGSLAKQNEQMKNAVIEHLKKKREQSGAPDQPIIHTDDNTPMTPLSPNNNTPGSSRRRVILKTINSILIG